MSLINSKFLIPDYIKTIIEEKGNKIMDVVFAVPGDISIQGFFKETWVVACTEKLILLSGAQKTPLNFRKQQKSNTTWEVKEYSEFTYEKIGKAFLRDTAGGGVLYITIDEKDKALCRYSLTLKKGIALMQQYLEKRIKKEEINIEEMISKQSQDYCPKCGRMYPDENRKICPKCMDKRSIFIRVLVYARNYKLKAGMIILFMLMVSGLTIIKPLLEGRVFFDEVLSADGKYAGMVIPVILVIVGFNILTAFFNIILGRINAYVSAMIIYDIKTGVFAALQKLSMSFFSNKQTGALMTRVNNDSSMLQYFFHDGIPYLVINVVNIIGVLIIMFSFQPILTLIILIPAPIILYMAKSFLPKFYAFHAKKYKRRRILNSQINDSLEGARVVRAFGREGDEKTRFKGMNQNAYVADITCSLYAATRFPLLNYGMTIGALAVWGYGGWLVIQGEMTLGSLITFSMYLGLLYSPLLSITNIVDWWAGCMNSAQRIFEIIDANPEIFNDLKAKIPRKKNEGIEIKNGTFSYEHNNEVLKNINLKINPGEMIGVVGPSGAGKSTFANLLIRLYDLDSGEILINGKDIKKIDLEWLHQNIGMVMQDTFLFSGTISENIAYSKPESGRDEILAAAKAANAHDFIIKLPFGYDTIIGKEGQDLSGGERQRLSIARTFLHDPNILILDEATASVDTETEMKIQTALDKILLNRTSVVIAHRLSTLKNADRIVVIDKGEIVEVGTHEQLLRKKGKFHEMIKTQKEALKIGKVIV